MHFRDRVLTVTLEQAIVGIAARGGLWLALGLVARGAPDAGLTLAKDGKPCAAIVLSLIHI